MLNKTLLQLIWIFPFLILSWWLDKAIAYFFPDNAGQQLAGATVLLALTVFFAMLATFGSWHVHMRLYHSDIDVAHLERIAVLDPGMAIRIRHAQRLHHLHRATRHSDSL